MSNELGVVAAILSSGAFLTFVGPLVYRRLYRGQVAQAQGAGEESVAAAALSWSQVSAQATVQLQEASRRMAAVMRVADETPDAMPFGNVRERIKAALRGDIRPVDERALP